MDTTDTPSLEAMRKELRGHSQHFSKIAQRFVFDNTAASYSSWVIQFRAEIEGYDLESTLVDAGDSELDAARQKAVYHMILACVPKVILSSLTTPTQHTAYHAWRTLRRIYIGDESTYLQSLETRFNRITWADGEEFSAFEIRFEQILSELEAVSQPKQDHVKRSTLMLAIEASNKKDVRGIHVYDRFNVVSKIHLKSSFEEWMMQIRVEAQQIRDAIQGEVGSRRGVKRTAEEPHDATPVSYVSSSMPSNRPPPFRAVRRGAGGGGGGVCFNMQKRGSCSFGANCKFSHDLSGASGKQEPCRNFLAGTCTWGDRCRFSHGNAGSARPDHPAKLEALHRVDASSMDHQFEPVSTTHPSRRQ